MSYIQHIRGMVGHAPVILVSAMVLPLDEHGRLLLQFQPRTGKWHTPGGYMELGEAIEDTAKRELLEETELEADRWQMAGVFSGPGFHWFAPNGDEVYNVTVAFIARGLRGTPRPDGDEGSALRFFPLSELPAELGPPSPVVLEKLMAQGILG